MRSAYLAAHASGWCTGDEAVICAHQVPVVEILEIGVWDADALANDRCLGVVEVSA